MAQRQVSFMTTSIEYILREEAMSTTTDLCLVAFLDSSTHKVKNLLAIYLGLIVGEDKVRDW